MAQVLVTGGGGFLGFELCRALLGRGIDVVSLQRSASTSLQQLGARCEQGDITDSATVLAAAQGCEAVFHVAAKAGHWGTREEYFRPNVLGTRNVISACRQLGIRKLIHTSTPSVAHTAHDVQGGNESLAYAERTQAHYPATKIIAEKEVLAANSAELATVALRPRLIWGFGDPHLLPNLVSRARAGRLRFVGNAEKLIDTTYIANAVHAHLLAFERLAPGAACAGNPYFISNGEPWPIGKVVNALLAVAGVAPVHKTVPFAIAWTVGALMELAWKLPLSGDPVMTRFLAEQLGTSHWYDLSAAERDLGYQPQVSMDEGMARLAQAWNA